MNVKSLGLALVAGLAAFLVVGVAVTEFTLRWIEFSLFLGLPAGLAAGAFTAAGVYLGLAEDAPAGRRRIAGAFAAFGGGFLVALLVLGWILEVGATAALVGSVVVALVVAAVAYARGPKEPAPVDGDGDAPGSAY